jgi:hypothetical protein
MRFERFVRFVRFEGFVRLIHVPKINIFVIEIMRMYRM